MEKAQETNKTGKRMLTGTVVSDAMDKTIVVKVLKFEKHPKYGKYIKQSKKYKVHDEKNEFKVGDKVTIIECRPMSREKRFRVATN